MMLERNKDGKFKKAPTGLGKTYGLRINRDLDPALAKLADAAGVTPTEWCRQQIEAAIAQAMEMTTETDAKES
jgi:predicted DNA-binding protein